MVEEFLVVLTHSRRTQFAIVMGVVFCAGLLLGGAYIASHVDLAGLSGRAEDAIIAKLVHKYDKAALICLLGWWSVAVKCYFKDRKRLLGL